MPATQAGGAGNSSDQVSVSNVAMLLYLLDKHIWVAAVPLVPSISSRNKHETARKLYTPGRPRQRTSSFAPPTPQSKREIVVNQLFLLH